MIKAKIKTIEQFMKEGAHFNERGDLVKKDSTEIESGMFCFLGKIFEDLDYDPDDKVFTITDNETKTGFFTVDEFEFIEGFEEKESSGLDTDDLKVFWHKNESGEIKFVHKDGSLCKKFEESISWIDVSEEF